MNPSKASPVAWLPLLIEIADAADRIALAFFRSTRLAVETKPDASPVTQADREIEAQARAILGRSRPDLGVLGEEYGATEGTSGTRLILDPIDGTRNFMRGVPIFASLLAIEEDGDLVAGLVSAPALGLRWHAARGAGAFCGDRRLHVSAIDRLEDAQIFHGDLGGSTETPPPPGGYELLRRAQRTRGFGDFYQHVLVAEGAGEVAIDPQVKPWDIAALQILVEEAGGRSSDLSGRRDIHGGSLVTTNGVLHETALALLRTPGSSPIKR